MKLSMILVTIVVLILLFDSIRILRKLNHNKKRIRKCTKRCKELLKSNSDMTAVCVQLFHENYKVDEVLDTGCLTSDSIRDAISIMAQD